MKSPEMKNPNLEIIAGPCSVNTASLNEIFSIADIATKDGPAISGTRVVGLKSRTSLDPTGKGMGIDWDYISELLRNPESSVVPPSVLMAEEIVSETRMRIATEIMLPDVQLKQFAGRIPKGKLLAWNPSVNQLGWQILQSSRIARENGWSIGIKNGKALGATLEEANDAKGKPTPMEIAWEGLATYARGIDEIIFIQRGVDVPEKEDHRNAPVHEAAKRIKQIHPDAKMFFDPSHIYGPKMRDEIVDETIRAMHLRERDNFIYDGILIEAGTSETDTNQHITLSELNDMVQDIATFRSLLGPEPTGVLFQSISIPAV